MLTRTKYGDPRVIEAVAAFMMMTGTLAWVAMSATAIACGDRSKPARNLTFSRSTSSSASCLDFSGPALVVSR